MFPRLVSGGFEPLPHAGHEISEAATHVESFDDVLSDAGSTPAASTNFFVSNQAVTLPVPAASRLLPVLEVRVPDSNSLIAASSAAGLRCMYCCVVVRS